MATGLATIYNSFGVKQGLVVTLPPPASQTGSAAPDGQVFNPNSANFGGAHFIFATEDGTISAWNGGTNAALKVDNSTQNTVFKGLALAANGSNTYLFATDFHNNAIDVFDTNFNKVTLERFVHRPYASIRLRAVRHSGIRRTVVCNVRSAGCRQAR